MTLDKYHWHEALHMADAINQMIEDWLLKHPTANEVPEEMIKNLWEVQGLIHQYYQCCCENQEKIDERKQ